MAYKPVTSGFNSAVPELGKFGNKNVGKFGKVEDTAAEKSDYSVSGFSKGGKGSGSSSDDDEGGSDIFDASIKLNGKYITLKRDKCMDMQ
ncbi:uncharacterized protein LOC143076842 isoform X2 [Mytilus galloprovincialis]|uniref:uncharacterized protein isoform X2 n=1 Tax=Mytilus edulis TaxID=6550 RepID=UPI0039EE3C4E